MDLSEAVERYVASRRWARGTVRGATHTFTHFVRATGDPLVAELTSEHVEAWWATQGKVAPSTARGRHSQVSNLFRWCRHAGLLEGDPMATIARPREPRRHPVTLSEDEVRRLMMVVPDERAALIVHLMLGLGLRCIDVHRLELADVDLVDRTLSVTGKGGHVDMLPLPDQLVRTLGRYLRQYPATAGPLVRAYDAPVRAVSAQRISEMMAAWLREAGVKQGRWDGRGAHALRRTCATELLFAGVNVRSVQAVLRHQSLASTQRYVRRSDVEELRVAVEREFC